MDVRAIIVQVGSAFEVVGVAILTVGALFAFARFAVDLFHKEPESVRYRAFRRDLARAIMLGLELLVAADIVRSVALEPTLQTVGVLALIVAVRTFLSWSLEVEITGKWPWRRVDTTAPVEGPTDL